MIPGGEVINVFPKNRKNRHKIMNGDEPLIVGICKIKMGEATLTQEQVYFRCSKSLDNAFWDGNPYYTSKPIPEFTRSSAIFNNC